MEKITGAIIIGCWIIFVGYWLISAPGQKATAERQTLLSALAHRIPVGLGWILLVYRRWPPPLNRILTPHAGWVLVSGAVICMFGLWVTLWARWTLAGNWSSDVTFKREHELVSTGPYRFVRHPIYTGLLVMCVGSAIDSGRLPAWLGVVVVGIGFWIKLNQEERLLLRHFPDTYPAYRKRVKALVPFVI